MVKIDERIKDLEKDLSSGKYDKSTAHHFALVKAQLSKLKERKEKQASSGKGVYGYSVRKSGDASVILVGFPSVGKSTLMNKLTENEKYAGFRDILLKKGSRFFKPARGRQWRYEGESRR